MVVVVGGRTLDGGVEMGGGDDKVNILLVDDQSAKLMTYEAVLKDLGENLLKASSAQEAFQHLLRTDVAVVGFGDIPMAEALAPAVTVLDQDPAGLGRIAVERLIQRIEDPHAPVRRKTVLPVRPIPRGSGELPPARA